MEIYCEVCQLRNEGNNHAEYFQHGIHVCENHYNKRLKGGKKQLSMNIGW